MRVLVIGASGMLGNAVLRVMSERNGWNVFGTVRSKNSALKLLAPRAHILYGISIENDEDILNAFKLSQPEIVVNCVGLVKQVLGGEDPLEAIPVNSLFPHRLARLSELACARLVHISTDCVFSGNKGCYSETDIPDAADIYGRSKLLGEVDYPHAITLRTSIIGHELQTAHGLVGWFLAQQGGVKGYANAIFSGLPTCELAKVICNFVIPNTDLHGVYQVAAEPISKYDLLQLVNNEYRKDLQIDRDEAIKINRSLDPSRFRNATGYVAPTWVELVAQMHEFR